jgi:formate hydrogenlyase subunit 3/multisubunit Na+/H+ antiporter MnhD subunit
MSTPLVWILAPALIAAILFVLRGWERATLAAGSITALLLAWLAWAAPVGERIDLGPMSLELADTLTILGRRFVLSSADRPVLILIYLAAAFWFLGARVAHTDSLFIPMGLAIASLLTAALAVEPFLYAALLIEMAALFSVPLLVTPGKNAGRGVTRFLTVQTLGVPFLLFTGWLLDGVDANPANQDLLFRVNILMGLGFAFFLGIFPFHTWIPMLAEESHPYQMSFVLFMLPLAILFFGLGILERYPWLSASGDLYALLRLAGGLMAVIGGFWAAFQRHLGRMVGFAVMVEIGLSLLAMGAGMDAEGQFRLLDVFFALLFPRLLSLGILALALVTVQAHFKELRFRSVQGMLRSLPVASGVLVLAYFSLAGFPLLAGFPAHFALWEGLAGQYTLAALAALLGSAGLLAGGLRMLAVGVIGPDDQVGVHGGASVPHAPLLMGETWGERALLALGAAALFVAGLFPQWFLPALAGLARLFGQ